MNRRRSQRNATYEATETLVFRKAFSTAFLTAFLTVLENMDMLCDRAEQREPRMHPKDLRTFLNIESTHLHDTFVNVMNNFQCKS